VAIKSTIIGHLAETAITMRFYNPNTAVMEGDLYFPLPEGATVSSYALDVKGLMVDGVAVDKDHGRQVFETEVRKGIDPGLVEWTRGNNFKTRVFPIPAKGTRTIRVSYVSEVIENQGQAYYYLPLRYRDPVTEFSLAVEVVRAAAKPIVTQGGPRGLSFMAARKSYIASAKLKNVKLVNDLYVRLPDLHKRPVHVQTASDGHTYFAIRMQPQANAAAAQTKPRRIGIYWDASFSRRHADHKKELALLESYLGQLSSGATAHVVVFRNVKQRAKTFRVPAQTQALLSFLRGIQYDGATQLGSLAGRGLPRADLNLLFSDGISNIGLEDPLGLKAPTYIINSSTSAGHALLRYVALRSGGRYFNLNRVNASQAVTAIGKTPFSFLSSDSEHGQKADCYPKVKTPVLGSFDLVGRLDSARANITLSFGSGQRASQTQRFAVDKRHATRGDLLRRLWAQKRVSELMIFPERNAEQIAQIGREHGLVTPYTSLIVLERLDQYVRYSIRPPAGLKKMRARYDQTMAQKQQQQRRIERDKLEHVLALWKKRLSWWNKRFRYPPNYRHHRRSPKKISMIRGRVARAEPSRPRTAPGRANGDHDLDDEAKDGKKSKAKGRRAAPQMSIKAWDPKTPYMAVIKQTPQSKQYATYLKERKQHGSAPAFYLDCANYFLRTKRRALGLRILSNLAELELENPALLRVLAHRLTQAGELSLATQIFDEVRRLRKEEPQSFRDLALVLERLADRQARRGKRKLARESYARALALLYKVVMQRWTRFSEIEVIALTELNNILPKARRLGLQKLPVDRRLIKQLTMDIRIVMSWDADNTDMDLHVIEPSGEEAYYSNNRTHIGGLVTRDFTRGYGPEVYAIRRAMRGVYKISTKYYGSSAAKLAGAVTLQVDVYTNYGRPNQKRRSITLRLTKRKETFTVGTIRF
jgi:Ca-activated chloride channel family protein